MAFPFTEILNASVNERRLPTMRMAADVTPLPKKKQVQILEKDLRPISLARLSLKWQRALLWTITSSH